MQSVHGGVYYRGLRRLVIIIPSPPCGRGMYGKVDGEGCYRGPPKLVVMIPSPPAGEGLG
jgi:hypothetical protein